MIQFLILLDTKCRKTENNRVTGLVDIEKGYSSMLDV